MDWKSIKKAADKTVQLPVVISGKSLDIAQKGLDEARKIHENDTKALHDDVNKGSIGYGIAGGTITPAIYWLAKYLRGEDPTPAGLALSTIGGYTVGHLGKNVYNATRPGMSARIEANRDMGKGLDAAQTLVDLARKNSSDINLVEKVAKDVSERYARNMRRNYGWYNNLRMKKHSVEVFDSNGNPGKLNGRQYKEEE